MHAAFKASVYAKLGKADLFIESDPVQSREIARLAGKPVLCYTTQQLVTPPMSLPRLSRDAGIFGSRLKRLLGRLARPLFGG